MTVVIILTSNRRKYVIMSISMKKQFDDNHFNKAPSKKRQGHPIEIERTG